MSKQDVRLTAQVGYRPQFRWSYLLPQYWGIWLGIFALVLLAYLPFRWRDKFAAKLGILVGRLAKKQRHKAKINLQYCFPQWSQEKQQKVLDQMFATVGQTMLGIGEIAIRSKTHLQTRSKITGLEYLHQAQQQGKNIILFVPHTWSIDASGIILHTQNIPMTAMYNPHRNPLVDWLWNWTRQRFGGQMHARQNGIKPFLQAIRQGEMGYYLPDEDYGEQLSVYANFFATYKATLPGLFKMSRVAKAVVIPMFSCYNAQNGYYEIQLHPPLELSSDPQQMANIMNTKIEQLVTPSPEQYVWILRLLKTRKNGEDIYS
ncbi:lauroyl-Kdo(2)-lipid IV(A) myristoyltransferase [Mergibacter septicus]|uniref:Lipid A biosynthesis acyltransferase n=1 Tax=Mergibacter septicus TaxID=221402 RepID=A0A8E3S7Z5_9PAST|nr:lauroyl-Kdo(2)-lipid IV(A) myristoyltransferase [Mergibacter septicus]AWX15147.1 lauroyl-Kdo(2)-lipid IV(A) myristoyltransferase [Mergibacter septicus]QDJ12664.1 lauroyl-Kdo(2)-lipid IV(A) myristoyltransferase [Mergibacter septicus]QDJ14400.1 lauroyl-Kdo(2)-lipid IV(A) myristoyltransferase [Mergibacter septicus]UTU48161.1 lauroyl-Kdo(2)-lipid IV(A) myristoyltransferase [Mergibacter septicus]WMR96221.1 lauroyl-Kdo(2)-lipid IV(A) myristoyltransferase [Mergibacter septicus]